MSWFRRAFTAKRPLKFLTELHGAGSGSGTIDTRSDEFMPLLMVIEEEIVRYNEKIDRSLTDGSVLLVLKQMCMDPDHEPADRLGGSTGPFDFA